MKKFLWLVLIVMLLITFSDSSLLRPYKEQLLELIEDNIAAAGDSKEAVLRKTRKELFALAEEWGDSQRDYLDKSSETIDSLKKFRRNFCINKDFNPILFGDPLKQSCTVIEKHYQNLIKP
ncbi:hypothetical protein [Rheinheimera baltica]|uniref:Uncharacterized protein n=1 Tax=Rheinheimera baltica TaxID=67576 RepID=A0ABT9I2I7_9GAMM|nr:hypothetical protein [Rheinheimera baltica]MDP5137600.1 hypothetical protein [Rheinheimera baltica]MDP5143673.1 hypothetical protein [Rheinheimera baltica]MDP5150962.1 hypothetical protein [Rheinheimera baltica]MDP5189657.1 hypothetical protein [Rheinheimera baltica]